jgi:stage II sporulation protein M
MFITELIEITIGLNMQQLIWFIFKNNIWSAFTGIIFGVFLGIIPLVSAVSNGYVLGFVSNAVVSEVGYLSLWRLLPHGIFEIPAIMISLGLGIKFGLFMFAKKPGKEFKRRFLLSMKTFLFVILPLLVMAALIEGVLMVVLG